MDQISSLITLTFPDARPDLTTLPEINAGLARYNARLWPIDLAAVPVRVAALLRQETLTAAECSAVLDHFLLSREELLRLIGEAGRKPQVAGGGEMETLDTSNRVRYPQLYLVDAGIDYSRFDRFHVNAAADGTVVDDILQLLSGGKIRLLLQIKNEGLVTLSLAADNSTGWIVTYDGRHPHIGSLTGARPGTKLLAQVIGPAEWIVRYQENANQ